MSRTAYCVLSTAREVARQTGARIRSDAVKRLTMEGIEKFGQLEEVRLAMAANVAVIHALNAQIDKIEVRLRPLR